MNDDCTITSVYCHWNGYPEYNGKILFENYNTEEKVRELISYGNLSELGTEIGNKHTFSFSPNKNWCSFYIRDKGEENCKATTYENIYEYEMAGEEYNYLFMNGKWYFNNYSNRDFIILSKNHFS